MNQALPVVAVFNSSEDTVEMLRQQLEESGFVVVSGRVSDLRRGAFDLTGFLQLHEPSVILYDLAPPYERNWNFLQHLRQSGPFRDYRFVLTTTNKSRIEELIGLSDAIEVVGKPYDLNAVVEAVRRAIAGPPA